MSLTAHRILQYIALILIFTAMAGGYWYWKSQAAVRINQGLEDSLEQGLVGYWKLDDASGTTATDSSGNGNNGTLTNGPTWGTGQVGGGVVLDGVDDRIVSVSNSPQIASLTKATVSFWVNPTQIGGIFNTLSDDFGGNGPFSNGFEITKDHWHGTQTIRLAVDGSAGDMMVHSTATLPLSTWTHVTVVWDGTLTSAGTKFYYNGSTAGTTMQTDGSGTYVPSDGRFKMGILTGGGGQLNGSLDEVRVYNRTLSDEEVKKLYQTTAPTGIDTGLVGYWPFDGDDISGTTAYDRSGKGINGTITAGITKVSGKVGQALDVASGNGIRVDSLTQTGQTYTFATWAKLTDTSTTYIFDTGFGRLTLDGGYNAPTARSISYYDGTWKSIGSANSIPLNEWAHLVWVLNSSNGTATGYINGVSVGTNSYIGKNISTETRIGSYYGGGAGITQGALDDFRIYNRALTAAEVQDLYQKTQSDTVGASNKRDSLAYGLAGYWKLDDASGTTATDSSTNGNNGTLTNGTTWSTGQISGAANFDGADDYVNIPDAPIYTPSALSVSFWKKDIDANYDRNFISKTATGNRSWRVMGSNADRGVRFVVSDALNTETNTGTTPDGIMAVGQWYHVTAVFNGAGSGNTGRMQIYINGVAQPLTFAGTIPATMMDNTTALNISGWQNGSGVMYGDMDEVRIYNRPLSAEEADRLYRTTAPTGVDTSLVGYWSFNGADVSGTTTYDRSGKGNNGSLVNGPSVIAGKIGQALSFDGADDYVITANNSALNAYPITVSTWIRTGVNDATRRYVFNKYNFPNGYAINLLNGKIRAWYLTGNSGTNYVYDGSDGMSSKTVVSDNQWHLVTFTVDASGGKLYIDGVLEDSRAWTGTAQATSNTEGVRWSDVVTGGSKITASLDETRIYNRALSVDEIREEYDYGKADKVNTAASDPLSDGLTGYWKLDDASGTTATDSSGNGHTGTLYNSPTWSTAGRVSGAVNFDGTNDYINIPSITSAQFGNTTFTFAGWIKTTGTDKYIAAQDYCNGGWGIWIDSFYKVFVGTRGAGACGAYTVYRYAVSAITPNEWHHIAAVIKTDTSVVANNAITIYIDGALNQDTPIVGSSPYGATGASGLQISGRYTNDQLFSGPLDEIRLYNRGLSAEEVRRLYRTTAPTGVDTGLVGYWSFNGADVSGTTAYDRSGKGNNGSLVNGPSVIAGKIGQALSFWPGGADTDAHVNVGDPASGVLDFGSGDFAVGFWMKSAGYVDQSSANNIPISKKNNDTPNSAGYIFRYGSDNKVMFSVGNGTSEVGLAASTATASDNQWHYYFGQRSGSTVSLYIDGVQTASGTLSGSVSNTLPFAIGSDTGIWRNVQGPVDEVRVYNRALTVAEIQNLYLKGK